MINDAFGYVAIQNTIRPRGAGSQLPQGQDARHAEHPASEDDEELAKGIGAREQAIGFFGYGVYQQNADPLKLVSVDGQLPNAGVRHVGRYPLARPLFSIRATASSRRSRRLPPFIGYYLQNVTAEIGSVGYFPASEEAITAGVDQWQRATGLTATTAPDLAGAPGNVTVTGSSTVAPITRHMAELAKAKGFPGEIQVESIGTDAGFKAFCLDTRPDIVDASRGDEHARHHRLRRQRAHSPRVRDRRRWHLGRGQSKERLGHQPHPGTTAGDLHEGDNLERD